MAVLDEHDLALDTIVLVRSGMIPKTSSGKVQRHDCRKAFLSGKLKTLAEYNGLMVENADPCDTISPGIKGTDSSVPHPHHSSQSSAFTAVCQHAHALAGAALSELTPNTPIIALGLDSLQHLELIAAIEKNFGGYMPDAAYCQTQTLGQLAQAVQKHLIDGPQVRRPGWPDSA